MKWSPSPDEPGKWRLERQKRYGTFVDLNSGTRTDAITTEHIASVESDGQHSLFSDSPVYAAEVVMDSPGRLGRGWRSAPTLFNSWKEAQLWCEQEVRLMEVGELV